ncbi:MAG: SDR family oxidoreductase [Acidobacteria bacterium]|nr:SDR family oxidoreductase [Acidobacteriota bacterium]
MSVILITGSNSGIGMATALYLAEKGHRIYASMRDLNHGNDLQAAATAKNLSVKTIRLDVNDETSVKEAVADVLSKEGRIDILINNAGIGPLGTIEETDEALAKSIFETNFFGALRTIRAVLPSMREKKSGTIINVSSTAGRIAPFCMGLYSASKFALEAASEALAQEVLSFGIRVRIVEPAFITTPILEKALDGLKPANESSYPNAVERIQMLFANGNENGGAPESVAETIEAAINSTDAQLRFPVGGDARMLLDGRARMSDEEWIAMCRHDSHEDYFQEFATRFPTVK